MHYNGQVMLTLRKHLITPPVIGGSMPVWLHLVFVNVIMDFYELGLRFRYLDPFTLYSLEVA